jgi:two-component system phosphate regulon sensor histidine kinase PhoR
MFWRLFLTYLLFVLAAVALVGAFVLNRVDDLPSGVFLGLAAICAAAVVPAYLIAKRFAQPLVDLNEGARRLADGEFGHKIALAGSPDHVALAETFNAMSDKLAASFAQLGHDREQLRTILSGMVEGVIAIDDGRRVVFANERAGKMLGFDATAAVHKKLADVVLLPAFHGIVETGVRADGAHRQELEIKDPPTRTFAVYVSRFPGHGVPGSVVVVNDVTEVRELEKMRQDFVANASHELKTPVAIIKSNAEALGDGAADDPETRTAFLGQITFECERLGELIKDMMSLARIESGALGLHLAAVPLDAAIADCLESHHTRADEKTLTVIEKPPKDAPANVAAWADPDALRQVLYNLMDNAIKYTPNGGKITIRWNVVRAGVSFEVEDTGVGIPEADLPRVFERFYRVDKARNREAGGTGLGLAIVKHLVQAMKGRVRVTSTVGKGTTFRVTLPKAG